MRTDKGIEIFDIVRKLIETLTYRNKRNEKKKKKKKRRLCGYIAQLIERRSARMAVEGSKPANGGFCLVLSFGGKLPKWNFERHQQTPLQSYHFFFQEESS